jgi:Tfp pilus assembly protein FimT
MTMVIAVLLALISIPLINNIYQSFRVNAAISAVTGAIQTTRYQAISAGYPFQVVFSKANSNYQVQSDPNRSGVFANVGDPVPLSTAVVLGQDTTLQCHPGGLITATVGSTSLTLSSRGKTETITVSTYGNIKVTP